MGDTLPHRAPEFRQISLDMLRLACRRAASDMRRAPLFGLFFCRLLRAVRMDIGAHLARNGTKLLVGFGRGRISHHRPLCRRGIIRGVAQVGGG